MPPLPKRRSAIVGCCLSLGDCLAWLPVIFVNTITIWSYYVIVGVLLTHIIESTYVALVYGIVYHIFLILFLWSYWKTILTKPMAPPPEFELTQEELDQMMADGESPTVADKDLPVHTHNGERRLRFCRHCYCIKPDRCHHCSVCRQCVLKMDHHCPWVRNCVGWHNYKYFCLFLFYAFTYLAIILLFTLRYFLLFWDDKLDGPNYIQIPFVFFVAFMFLASLFGLFSYHTFLILTNTTTLEAYKKPHFWNESVSKKWSLSTKRANFEEVFGPFSLKWFLPLDTSIGDGVRFPILVPLEGVEVRDGDSESASLVGRESSGMHASAPVEEGLSLDGLDSRGQKEDEQRLIPASQV